MKEEVTVDQFLSLLASAVTLKHVRACNVACMLLFLLFLPIFHQTLQFLESLSFRGAAATRNKLSVGKQNKTLQNGKISVHCTWPKSCSGVFGMWWRVVGSSGRIRVSGSFDSKLPVKACFSDSAPSRSSEFSLC